MAIHNDKPVCIVTGGSVGIGAAICRQFADNGYEVHNFDINAPTEQMLSVTWHACDMTNPRDVDTCITSAIGSSGRIEVLVSNAGIHFSGNIEQTSEAQFERVFDINVKSAISITKAVLPHMKKQNQGVILYMASDQALIAKSNSFAYNLSKAALASLAKTTAIDYAKFNIRANAICPGTIETPLYHQAIDNYVASSGADESQVHQQEAALQPLGRLGKPEEVAALAFFLASDQGSFITGSLQLIDGGYTAQ
ncbi:SDR family oxidoreductase [Aliiglaciecola sp.]|nr:SDR family oxidoreductase [Aliiglaciecola sp.]